MTTIDIITRESIMQSSALIIGCGYLGSRVARMWRSAGVQVSALTRARSDILANDGVVPIIGDVMQPPSLPPTDVVLYAVGMDRSAGHSMHDVYVTGLSNVLHALPTKSRLIYVSSTSIYGFTNGELVDESSKCEPHDDSGRTILEAEQTLRQLRPDAIVLRFTGIYGPNRLLREKAIRAGEPLVGDAEKWLNLIHVEDGATAVDLASKVGTPGETYNVSDGHPVHRREFYTLLAELLQAPPATFVPHPPGTEIPSHDRGNRRIRNSKLCHDLGFVPKYSSFAEGLRAIVVPH